MSNRKSLRLTDFDYSSDGMYFVTICTFEHLCIFGKIDRDKMILNECGQIAFECWINITDHFAFVDLDEYIIMPNHIHGIIVLNSIRRGTACRAPTAERFGKPVPGSIPTIIRSYKSAVTKRINEIHKTPTRYIWQRNYYDHIVRNDKDLSNIREYIVNNPINWEKDEYKSK